MTTMVSLDNSDTKMPARGTLAGINASASPEEVTSYKGQTSNGR